MDMNAAVKNSLFTAIVVGTSTTAAYAAAELGDAQVVQADVSGFEATVQLKNQPIEEIESIDLTKNSVAAQANSEAARKLVVSLDPNVDGSNINHLIRVSGPGSVSAENLAFNVQVTKLDGSKLVKSYELLPEAKRTPAMLAKLNENQAVSERATVAAESPVSNAVASAAQSDNPAVLTAKKSEKPAVQKVKAENKTSVATNLVLSEVQTKSSMGEKLSLEFEVAANGSVDKKDFQVQVTPDSSLGALSTEAVIALASMDQKILEKGNNSYVVQLTSDQPVNEPLVPLLVNVQVGSIAESRQYSVLLDPPKQADQQMQQAEIPYLAGNGDFIMVDKQPAGKKPARHAVGNKKDSRLAPSSVAVARKGKAGSSKNTAVYTVSEGETLASIAANLRGKAPLNEKIRYLRDTNPQAFAGGDINKLVAGTALSIPSSWKVINNRTEVKANGSIDTSIAAIPEPSRVEMLAQAQAGTQQAQITESMVADASQDQLVGDEAIVAEIPDPKSVPVTAKTETVNPVVPAAAVETAKTEIQGESLLDSTDGVALAGGAAAAALAAGGFVMMRRRKKAGADSEEFSLDGQTADDGELANDTAFTLFHHADEEVNLGSVDYVAEADAFMARGQIDQALLVLQNAVEEQPGNSAAVLKLLEVIAVKGDSAMFNASAIASAALLRKDKALLNKANGLAQKMNPVPEIFRNMPENSVQKNMQQANT